jgi:hypothetical protein
VVETSDVDHEQTPERQSEGPPNGQAENQDQAESEGTAVKDADQTKDRRLRWYRVAAAGVLLLVALGLVVWLFVRPPDSFEVTASVVVAVALIFGAGAVCLPPGLRQRLGTFAFVAGTSAAILAAVLAIPDRPLVSSGSDESKGPASESPPPASPSPEPDPFTAKLKFGPRGSPCEGLVVHKKLLRPLSKMKPEDIDAKWAYESGGATQDGKMILTIQGRSPTAVIVDSLRVVDFERRAAPANNLKVLPCDPQGGLQTVRYFEVSLGKRARVVPRPSDPDPNPDYKQQPAAKFPFKVSRSDPEVFELWVTGPDCLCTWRLAIDWTSGDRSGTTYLDHGFDKIRTITNRDQDLPSYFYDSKSGWVPPLPK